MRLRMIVRQLDAAHSDMISDKAERPTTPQIKIPGNIAAPSNPTMIITKRVRFNGKAVHVEYECSKSSLSGLFVVFHWRLEET